ncbi:MULTISPECIES: hypothetical protein [unclassified Paenibacillus]|uniref:hypothetical protein n=1 Tax=unclassified Paenibacillus TaxID=185978 RepID=UPI002407560C|nr:MULTISPECIES: hypothetical protein [unclassified Paenibacillus]MDF9840849.1 hypothetical protein [Paenibacillus sp. PastF-2]MDF9847433.1 hypothetical protein [Paenibacillus sp. PastM-2]MDF9853990.1 hypothetical protein [Paenibacillus sp. PastF-1]MDH6479262.1 hypothetical protein [Paenibacillus sp. PastH-2]MDH6507002.1 hypothetical protein [Paenibacillus sp. PastM-3]
MLFASKSLPALRARHERAYGRLLIVACGCPAGEQPQTTGRELEAAGSSVFYGKEIPAFYFSE